MIGAETILLWGGVVACLAATAIAWRGLVTVRIDDSAVPGQRRKVDQAWLLAAVVLVAGALALRWVRLGHGPFFTFYEILASSLVSLGAIHIVAARRSPMVQAAAPPVYAVLALLAVWLATRRAVDSHFAPTYATPVLWFHVAFGKLFLGLALVALGFACAVLLRATVRGRRWFARLPADAQLDALAWRFMQLALLFETLMLIAGSVWAQDAWGRYWDWDPLETWAFLTWIALVGALHLRTTRRLAPRLGAWLVVAVFVLAFLTFFGVPFVSEAPHKGAI